MSNVVTLPERSGGSEGKGADGAVAAVKYIRAEYLQHSECGCTRFELQRGGVIVCTYCNVPLNSVRFVEVE